MKNICMLIMTCLMSSWAFAQQALWGGSNIVSPQVNEDHTVTFRIYAPKASKVEVEGDFLAAKTVDTPFGKQDAPTKASLKEVKPGLWEYTTVPLASELYSYVFYVNDMRVLDPSNVFLSRDVATIQNIFIVGDGRGDNYMVQDVPHGNVAKVWYESPTLGMDQRRMTVYTPAGYEDSKKKYPVLS